MLVTPAQVKAVLKAASEPIPYRNVVFEKSVVPHVRPEFALAAAGMLTSLQEQPFHERVLKAATSARDAQKESLAKKITQPNQLSAAQSAAEESIEAIATALDPVKAVSDDEKGKVVLTRLESTGSAIINEYHQPNNGNDGGAPATQQGAEGSDSPSAPAEDGAAQEPAQDENANPAEGDDASDDVQADGGVLRRTSRVASASRLSSLHPIRRRRAARSPSPPRRRRRSRARPSAWLRRVRPSTSSPIQLVAKSPRLGSVTMILLSSQL